MTSGPVRDFDFHPDENHVRVFTADPGGVLRFSSDIYLFADLLVRADAASYRVCDLDELEQACRNELILPGEARGAARGVAELTAIVERGDLLAFLSRACPVGPMQPPTAAPVGHVPLSRVPLLDLDSRAAWLGRMPLSP